MKKFNIPIMEILEVENREKKNGYNERNSSKVFPELKIQMQIGPHRGLSFLLLPADASQAPALHRRWSSFGSTAVKRQTKVLALIRHRLVKQPKRNKINK